MTKYYVAKNLNHDSRAYTRGEEVELTEPAAAPLLEDAVIQTEPIVNPEPPANRDRVRQSPKKGKDEATVGGARTETGEPSIDDQQERQTEAKDVTPQTEEPQTPGFLGRIFGGQSTADAPNIPATSTAPELPQVPGTTPATAPETPNDPSANL